MTLKQFNRALSLAQSDAEITPCDTFDMTDGFGLEDFKPIGLTIEGLARLMRWQAARWDGTWDGEALNEIREHGRKKFMIIGSLA